MRHQKPTVILQFALVLIIMLPLACRQTPPPKPPVPTVTLSGHILTAEGQAPEMADVSFFDPAKKDRDLRVVPADPSGAFSLKLPQTTALSLHFTAVDHVETVLPVVLDSDATLEITLRPNPYKESFETVEFTASWNKYSMKEPEEMTKKDNGSFVWEGDATLEVVGYELMGITTNDHIVNGTLSDAFEYDKGGDYRSLLHPKKGKLRIVFDPKLLPRPSGEGLPKLVFDEAHEELEQMGTLAIDAFSMGTKFQKAMATYMETREEGSAFDPTKIDCDTAPLKNELLLAIGHGASERLRSYAAMLLASENQKVYTIELSEDDHAAIRNAAPAASPMWSFAPWAFSPAAGKDQSFFKEGLDSNLDPRVKREAVAGLIRLAMADDDIETARSYYQRLKRDFAELRGSSYLLRSLNPDKKIKVGNRLPKFSVDLLDGSKLSNEDLKGHWTLIDFWATWCGPCVGEMPNLQKAWEKFHPEGLEILSLSLDKSTEDLAKFREDKWKMPWKHAFLEGGFDSDLANNFEVLSIPRPLLVSPEGKIVAMERDTRGEQLLETLGTVMHPSAAVDE